MSNPAGWYPDPDGKPCERFWNGLRWTNKTRPTSQSKDKNKIDKKVSLSPFEKKVALYGCLPVALLLLGGCIVLLNSGDSSADKVTPEVAISSSDPKPSVEVDLQENAKLGGFSDSDLEEIKNSRSELYSYVESWAGLVAGNVSSAEVSIYCSNLEGTNNRLRSISSSSPYFEDLLDRAKDYTYETRSECQYAFKKNRLENLGQAAEYAGTGIAFFDRLISEAESNK